MPPPAPPALPVRLTILGRGGSPLPRQAAGLTYHHVIPFNRLMAFWNRCVGHHLLRLRQDFARDLARAVPTYALDQRRPDQTAPLVAGTVGLLGRLHAGAYAHAGAAADSPPNFNDFTAVYTWMPGNLFAGPLSQWRLNDPGDRFDTFASRFLPHPQYLDVLRADRAITQFLAAAPAGGFAGGPAGTLARKAADHLAHVACRALARVAGYPAPPPYAADLWTLYTVPPGDR